MVDFTRIPGFFDVFHAVAERLPAEDVAALSATSADLRRFVAGSAPLRERLRRRRIELAFSELSRRYECDLPRAVEVPFEAKRVYVTIAEQQEYTPTGVDWKAVVKRAFHDVFLMYQMSMHMCKEYLGSWIIHRQPDHIGIARNYAKLFREVYAGFGWNFAPGFHSNALIAPSVPETAVQAALPSCIHHFPPSSP